MCADDDNDKIALWKKRCVVVSSFPFFFAVAFRFYTTQKWCYVFFPKHLLSVFLFYLISFFTTVALACGTWALFVPVDPKNHLIVAAPRLKTKYKTQFAFSK